MIIYFKITKFGLIVEFVIIILKFIDVFKLKKKLKGSLIINYYYFFINKLL